MAGHGGHADVPVHRHRRARRACSSISASATRQLLDEHRALIAAAVESAGGRVFGTEGDAVFARSRLLPPALPPRPRRSARSRRTSGRPTAASACAWASTPARRSRADGDYVGLTVHQVARIMSAGHGGQVLVSEATRRRRTRRCRPASSCATLASAVSRTWPHRSACTSSIIEGFDERFPPLQARSTRTRTTCPFS